MRTAELSWMSNNSLGLAKAGILKQIPPAVAVG